MKKKILLLEPNETLRVTLSEQLIINKDFDITLVDNLQETKWHIAKSPFDLLILGENINSYSISSFLNFIKERQVTNKILFMKDYGSGEISSTEGFTDNHHFIEKPFRIQHLIKKIDFVLAKISGSTDVTHIIGPFVFFPEKKIITFNDQADIELTEKEVGILKCLLSSGEEIVDKDEILKQVWNYNPGVTTHTLETHIYRLRQKLEISPSIPRIIVSEGGGFKLNPV